VRVGAGAKILGAITNGRNSLIGANAVVVKDVTADSVATGIPATVSRKESGKTDAEYYDPAAWI
jgi:serine O-acetyltransferase